MRFPWLEVPQCLQPVREWTRIADPKLDGGIVHVTYFLEPTTSRYDVTITVLSGGTQVRTLFQGKEVVPSWH